MHPRRREQHRIPRRPPQRLIGNDPMPPLPKELDERLDDLLRFHAELPSRVRAAHRKRRHENKSRRPSPVAGKMDVGEYQAAATDELEARAAASTQRLTV